MALSQRPDTACAQITGGGALVAGSSFNIASAVRTGLGAYTVVTNRSFTFPIIDIQIIGGAAQTGAQVLPVADKITFNVTTFVAAAAADATFIISLEESIL